MTNLFLEPVSVCLQNLPPINYARCYQLFSKYSGYLQDSDPESELAEEVWPGKTQSDGGAKDSLYDEDDFDFYD